MISPAQFSTELLKKNTFNIKHGLRHLVVLNGKIDWVLNYLTTIEPIKNTFREINAADRLSEKPQNTCLIYSDDIQLPTNVTAQNYRQKLGTQSEVVVYKDKFLHLDILCALAGTLVAGGVLFIILETNDTNNLHADNVFLQRFWEKIHEAPFIWKIIEDNQALAPFNELQSFERNLKGRFEIDFVNSAESFQYKNHTVNVDFPLGTRTQDQYQAVLAILNVVKGHRNRPLVLTADRGRGKSSALAIACAELIKEGDSPHNIIICAPHRHSVGIFFTQLLISLTSVLPDSSCVFKGNILTCGKSTVQFIPIDELIQNKIDVQLILVDEAASIPVYLLIELAKKYSRLVFSTTEHGYEGAGRGFGLIFKKSLKALSPEMQNLHIKTPIRWSINDPLEGFISDLCLLNASLPELKTRPSTSMSQCVFQRITANELMNNNRLLNDVFAILVTAHYQTSPNDLKLLLENPKIHTLVLTNANQVIAVALVMNEGGQLDCDISDIQKGKRRVKDQFLPQSLLSHLGIQESFDYSYHRILRIAVHPEIQNSGVGSYFIEKIKNYSQELDIDFIGASFGLSLSLLNFWLKTNFNITRIGFSKDKASGEYSVMMMKGLSLKSKALQDHLHASFYPQFNYLLSDEYADLPAPIVNRILSSCPESYLPELTESDLQATNDFALSYRQYSCCVLGLHRWLQHHLVMIKHDKNDKNYERENSYALIMRVFQKHSVSEISKALGFKGKKDLQNHMVEYVKKHVI